VLQALGYRPRQVISTSLWQATTTAVVAVVVGVPIGMIVGRWVWMLLNRQLAAAADPTTPVAAVAVLAVAVLVLVNGLGLVPGWRASRRSPAMALKAE
jgi:putative ABC transport system permease protein